MYIIMHPNSMRIYWIDNFDLYKENFNILNKSLKYREKIDEIIAQLMPIIKRGKDILYTKNLRKFEEMVKKHENGRIGFDEYLQYLFGKYSVVADLSANFESKSHTRLKSKIIRQEYPEIAKQLKVFETVKGINKKQVMWEAQQVVKQVAGYLNNNEKNILKTTQGTEEYYTYLGKLFKRKNVMCATYRSLSRYLSCLEQKKE